MTAGERDVRLCACGHTIGSHYAEPYCPACAGDLCDLDFRDWLRDHDAEVRAQAKRDAVGPVEEAREWLRLHMLAQPITEERDTYSDGYASGVCTGIERIDQALRAALGEQP